MPLTAADYQLTSLQDIWETLPASLHRIDRRFHEASGMEPEEYDEQDRDGPCIYFAGDARLSSEQWDAIRKPYDCWLPLVVRGNLEFTGKRDLPDCYVTGDVICDRMYYHPDNVCVIGGKLTARHYAAAWAEAAAALYLADAVEQAIPYAEKAMELLPEALHPLHDSSADHLLLCRLRLRQWDKAIALADQLIARYDTSDYRLVAYRVRGEAWMQRGQAEKAREDLAHANAIAYDNPLIQWLLGRVHHTLGNRKEANHFHELASRRSGIYKASYADNAGSEFRYSPALRVDWDIAS